MFQPETALLFQWSSQEHLIGEDTDGGKPQNRAAQHIKCGAVVYATERRAGVDKVPMPAGKQRREILWIRPVNFLLEAAAHELREDLDRGAAK